VSDQYTPFRTSFPSFILADAFGVIKAGGIDKAGAETLSHCAIELQLWGLGAYFGHASGKPSVASTFGVSEFSPLSDVEAHALLEQSQAETPGLMGFACPISPSTAISLALWLLKIVGPILL
jgi:hypothetical protein